MRYKAACVQFNPEWGAKEANCRELAAWVRRAAANGARLVVLPEMATTGYVFASREEIEPLVETIPGPTSAFFGRLAQECRVHLAVSYPEVEPDTNVYYNTAVLLDDEGQLVGKYRKLHSFVDETRWAKDGDGGIPVFETKLGTLAMMICMDATYFETARLARHAGAEVILFPNNWLNKAPSLSWRARALENDVYFIAADRWGEERGVRFAGGSCIIDGRGQILAQQDTGDGLVMAQITLNEKNVAVQEEFGDAWERRRPSEYHSLVINSYLWAPSTVHSLPPGTESIIGVLQPKAQPHAPQAMLEGTEAAIAHVCKSTDDPPDLLVLPEAWIAGGEGAVRWAESIPGPLTSTLMKWAEQYGVILVAGVPECAEGRHYSSVVMVGAEEIYGVYRKLHLTLRDEAWCQPGNLGVPVIDLPLGRVALLTASDLFYPEIVRCAAKRGADLICAPANWPRELPTWLWKERWVGNDTALAVANLCGGPWAGDSSVFGNLESRDCLRVEGENTAACLRLRTEENSCIRQKEILRKLQPFWYDPLVTPKSTIREREDE